MSRCLRRTAALLLTTNLLGHPLLTCAWTSVATQPQLYTFQEFYTDAQYGPDFGYYSKGRILHTDGGSESEQEWFNSYTTVPMALSPHFAGVVCDRLVTMWESMGRPHTVVITEFGGGTGMLARDILRRSRDGHADFHAAVAAYVIGERSAALRVAQTRTAAEFVSEGKLLVVSADARSAATKIRPVLNAVTGGGQPVVGFVLSNELFDEFDPVRLHLVWRVGRPPPRSVCLDCGAYREAHIVHRLDTSTLAALLKRSGGVLGDGARAATLAELEWESNALSCGLVATRALARVMSAMAEHLASVERGHCAPMLVCCLPFLLAVDQALQHEYDSMRWNGPSGGEWDLLRLYKYHLASSNGTVLLPRERYRELRRLAAAGGPDLEKALLVGEPAGLLPGRLRSSEVFLVPSAARCAELQGWRRRHGARLAATAALRDASPWARPRGSAAHLKLVLRPGEAAFVQQASALVDEGFMVTVDYGADADALMWLALLRPHYEGIHIMDAREEFRDCTLAGYLECPGLQDLTTSVDFTEVAEAGLELGAWEVRAYGPMFLLELSFDAAGLDLAPGSPEGLPYRLGHIVERAGGMRTSGVQSWYQKNEQDPWVAFKVIVQHRGTRGANWTLGPLGTQWPLERSPRLFRNPSACWRRDLTKPPLAALLASAAHHALGARASAAYDGVPRLAGRRAASEGRQKPSRAALSAAELAAEVGGEAAVTEGARDENWELHAALLRELWSVLARGKEPVHAVIDRQHYEQQRAYADAHLALLLADYWRLLRPGSPAEALAGRAQRLDDVRNLAELRRLPQLYGAPAFERVFGDLSREVFGNATLPSNEPYPPYVCLAAVALQGLGGAW